MEMPADPLFDFDLVIFGSGPAGQKAAIAAAKMGKHVAVVDGKHKLGGVCIHTGTIPSKTLREAVLFLSGHRQKGLYGKAYAVKEEITMADLLYKVTRVITHESEVIRNQLRRNGVTLFAGKASFIDPNTAVIHCDLDTKIVTSRYFVIATGTVPTRPKTVPFDGETVIDSDELLRLKRIPRQMIVVGGGVVGLEYANMFAALGTEITLIDGRRQLLDFVDREIMDTLVFHLRSMGVTFRLGENVAAVARDAKGRVVATLESGKRVVGETLLFCAGRKPCHDDLNLHLAGVTVDERGRITHDGTFRTDAPNIYAVGDVVGFPALASASMEQGRHAALAMFGHDDRPMARVLPFGIYTIPEISMIGANEEDLTRDRVPYEVGQARFGEIAKGQIVGDDQGMLKILFHRETRKILGVHSIGESSTEIVHVGQAVMELGGTVEYFRDTVFNYPTMTECYKVAALDGLNKLVDLEMPVAPAPAAQTPVA